MSGRHPFAELRAKIPPEAMARAAERNKHLHQEMNLAGLRQALKLSQQQLAKKLRVNQPEVAKIEKRADMLLSTLAAVLRALGADLKIVASFPGHDIQIRSLGKLSDGAKGRRVTAEKRRLVATPARRVAKIARLVRLKMR